MSLQLQTDSVQLSVGVLNQPHCILQRSFRTIAPWNIACSAITLEYREILSQLKHLCFSTVTTGFTLFQWEGIPKDPMIHVLMVFNSLII